MRVSVLAGLSRVRRERIVPSFPQAHSLQAGSGETVGAWPHRNSRPEMEAPQQLWGPQWPGAMCAGSVQLRAGFPNLLLAGSCYVPLTAESTTAQRSVSPPGWIPWCGMFHGPALPPVFGVAPNSEHSKTGTVLATVRQVAGATWTSRPQVVGHGGRAEQVSLRGWAEWGPS